jgi:transcriptional regulator with PAS, ATPase and Fis domain
MKKKILVSWMAFNADFKSKDSDEVSDTGTHGYFYSRFRDYDEHYLLVTEESRKSYNLVNYLESDSSVKVIVREIKIFDLLSVDEILDKVEQELIDLRGNEVEVMVSPGTPSMQTAWYLIASKYKLGYVTYFALKPPHKGHVYKKYSLEIDNHDYVHKITIRNLRAKTENFNHFIKPDSLVSAYELADKIARTKKVTTLILGESGTGKEVIAQYVHDNSARSGKKLIAINCAGFSDNLLESRLFGYEKGAFTGALDKADGAFHDADGSTLFLDEIGDISEFMQQTLLRVLDTNKVTRIGSTAQEKVDVRIICATNKDLLDLVKKGEFRMDLYYRLAIAEVTLPPLKAYTKREKKEAIIYFLKYWSTEMSSPILDLSDEAWEFILDYHFPGNYRELKNVVERFYTFCTGVVKMKDIPYSMRSGSLGDSLLLAEIENKHIEKVLGLFNGDKVKTHKALGLSYSGLNNKIKKMSIES